MDVGLNIGSNVIGKVGIDQTTPGTTNGVQVNAAIPTGSNVIGGVTQSGTWTVQPGNTANTTAWKVDGSAVTQPVSGTVTINAIPAGSNLIGQVTSSSTVITASAMTRPADTTAYAVGDLVANNTTAASVTPITLPIARANDSTTSVRRLRLAKSTTTTTNAQFRVHLWKTTPGTPTNGDNGALSVANVANYIGYVDIDMTTAPTVNSDGLKGWGAPAIGSEILCLPSSGTQNVFALLEARAAYSPGNAETFTLAAEVLQD